MSKIIVAVFLSFLGGICFLHVYTKDVQFSENENRVLTQMPDLNVKDFLSGKFSSDIEKYLSDQFVKKDFWISIKTKAEQALLKQENNGVFFGKDDYLFAKFDKPGDQLDDNVKKLYTFATKNNVVPSYLLLAPTSIEFYPEKLPLFAKTESQKDMIDHVHEVLDESIKPIDVFGPLMNAKDEQIYYRTDHHWTTRGAYYAYVSTAKAMGIKPFDINDFTIEIVSNNFYGTTYSKANDYSIQPDKIEVFKPNEEITYKVEYEDSGEVFDSLYNRDYLQKRDQYSLFLDGNHSKVKITSSNTSGGNLLVIKDSFAHSVVPFLANHFHEIHMIDLRYFHSDINSYIKENKIDSVLYLYNTDTFSKDTNFGWLR